ncbi:MAG: ATP synthase F1 subunit gamma [candidate division KSB1 bacterium]|nr:ATP synthase F1 subunit gamma [candidate division KSB1 bacterium]
MATLREIRRRLTSIQSTQQITRAMKMVAAVKLRRAQEKILRARPYAYRLNEVLGHVASLMNGSGHPLMAIREPRRVCYVVVTSDRGLCGAFNSNIIRKAIHEIQAHKDSEVSLIAVGKKGRDYLQKHNYPLIAQYADFFDELGFQHAQEIAGKVIQLYSNQEVDLVCFIYNEFKSAVQQRLVTEQLLPIIPLLPREEKRWMSYLYEPSPEAILGVLCPKQINIQVWRVLLESNAAEQGARMTAMEMATNNAQEMIQQLTLYYNKVRQAIITKEISEIVGGAEALKK